MLKKTFAFVFITLLIGFALMLLPTTHSASATTIYYASPDFAGSADGFFEGVDFIDSQGSEKLSEILDLAETYGAEVRLARVKPAVIALLRRDGVIDELGEENVYGNVYQACADRIPNA